ncbi:hypothetical protein SBRCBS47491_005903 [Sporothrix bragantina]|uniref:Cupin type-2 domain-containing protein n=1 Tax=Sporothrix bragantina TaxID=671064 RepID=A0ABP0C0E7_9PEZI
MTSSSSKGQLSGPSLNQQKVLVTSHNADGKAIVHSTEDFQWQPYDGNQMAFSVLFSTSQFPADLNNNADIASHEKLLQSNTGLVSPNGTILRCVDFAPGYKCGMHRTQSLDYGIVMAGDIDMILDSGGVHHLKAGDVAVQRATNHQWANTSDTEWARMMFVLQGCAPLTVGDKTLGEDLGEDLAFLPASHV